MSQALSRVASRVKWIYEKLVYDVRDSPAVFEDETSWWAGRPKYWLWIFTTAERTVYRVDHNRGSAVVRDILGDDFDGMLISDSDCLSSYEPAQYAKHKCIAHHLRAISKAMKYLHTDEDKCLLAWKSFFHVVIALYHLRQVISEEDFSHKRKLMESWRNKLLNEIVSQPGDVAVRNRLAKQHRHLLGCLNEPLAEPTNNRAERALRAAVISRKLSGGNKTERGRDCRRILSSIVVTCQQQMIEFVEYLCCYLPLTSTAG